MQKKHSWLILIIFPIIAIAIMHLLFGAILYDVIGWRSRIILALVEMVSLLFLLILLWFPTWLIIAEEKDYVEISSLYIRNAFLLFVTVIVIPYDLLNNYFKFEITLGNYLAFTIPITLIFFAIARMHAFKTPYRDVRELESGRPRKKKAKSRWLLFDVSALFLTLLVVICVHLWFFVSLDTGKSKLMPTLLIQYVEQRFLSSEENSVSALESVNPEVGLEMNTSSIGIQERDNQPGSNVTEETLHSTAVASAVLLPAILFFLISCLPIRIMQALLVVVTFHERNVVSVLYKSHRYLWHFAHAIIRKYPVLISGSMFTTFLLLIVPLMLFFFNGIELYKNIHNADVIIFALVVFYAWFGQIALAAVQPDETFGEYFDQRLASSIMVIQDHTVFFGYGSLGKRVVEREISEMWRSTYREQKGKKEKLFIETVTPDLTLEYICTSAIIVDIASVNIIYSSQNSLLEHYGVVSPFRYKSVTDEQRIHQRPESRLLVPTVVGDAKDPFISSRVNLERAKLLIAMIPDERSIQELFEHVCSYKQEYKDNKESLNAIICVVRSDQISYLTHRSRSRRIVLVYPKFNQGMTIGQRLWAAMLKVRSIRMEEGKIRWPKVLIAGNNKSNHYMLETLWPQLEVNPKRDGFKDKNEIIEKNFAAIFTFQDGLSYYPVLKDRILQIDEKSNFDKVWPATLQTSSRYPTGDGNEIPEEILIRTKAIYDIDIVSLETCFEEHKPDILVINHEDVEKSLLLLSRSMRALERLKSINKPIRLPLILLSASHGNDWELLNLGDASRYYDVLCKIHQSDLGADLSYPGPSYYNHSGRRLIGETISDLNADMEEIIEGARKSLISKNDDNFIEINTCVQNQPGALAAYIAKLARLHFNRSQIKDFWGQKNSREEPVDMRLPSFQYMRDIILDPDGQKFALTGYATLTSVNDLKNEDYTGTSTIRIFTNNGESYRESEFDIDLAQDTYASVEEKKTVRDIAVQEHEAKRKYTTEPPKPGVPEVIDRIMIRDPGAYNSVDEYHNVLYNPGKNNESGPFACPGMANCRIAAFQDFVSASNNKRIFRYVSNNKADIYKPEKLLHVRNYYCSSSNLDQDVLKKVKPGLSSYYARIFCCCSVENDYGMIAMVLNHLIFRNFEKIVEPENKNDDWAISVQYLKDETCHNRYFSLNRVFGKVIKNPKFNEFNPNKPPMHLLRILPIGSPESARLWYIYAKSIYGFFKEIFQDYSYIFKWINQNRASRSFDQEPDFSSKSSGEYPIVYIIKKLTDDIEQVDFCKLCKTQPSEFDCRNLRAWV